MKLQKILCEVCFISPHHELINSLHNSLIPVIHVVELLERQNERNEPLVSAADHEEGTRDESLRTCALGG